MINELEIVSEVLAHGGVQGVYRHRSTATGTAMTFSVFVPRHEEGERLPVLWYLSGLTCTHANVTDKGEYRRACAEAGVVLVAPDTSPRGEGVPDDPAWDFGQGAGFYVDATQAPWAEHFRMRSYVEDELPALIAANFPINPERVAPLLRRLISPTKTRARIYDRDANLLLDSSRLYSRGQILRYNLPPVAEESNWFEQAEDYVISFFRRTDLPVYKEAPGGSGTAFPEVMNALNGGPSTTVRSGEQGELVVSVAVPVQPATVKVPAGSMKKKL